MKDLIKQAIACGALVCAFASTNVLAAKLPISLTGDFEEDQNIQWFEGRIAHNHLISIATRSYAGGANAWGEVIDAGGFDPIVAIYDKKGNKLAFNNDYLGAPADPGTGLSYDAGLFSLDLEEECVVLIALSRNDGEDARTGHWAVDFWGFNRVVTIDSGVEIPVPAAGLLFGSALLGLSVIRRRQA